VRSLSMEKGRKRARIGPMAKDPVRWRQAIVVLMSARGQAVPDITSLMQVSAEYMRDLIKAFNEWGFAALDLKRRGERRG
jgi:transposase